MNRTELLVRFTAVFLPPLAALGLLVLAPGGDHVALADSDSTRDLTGSDVTVDRTFYVTPTANTFSFTVYNGSTDMEYVAGVTLTLPAGWTIDAAQGDAEDSFPSPVDFTTAGVGTNEISFNDNDGGNGDVNDDDITDFLLTGLDRAYVVAGIETNDDEDSDSDSDSDSGSLSDSGRVSRQRQLRRRQRSRVPSPESRTPSPAARGPLPAAHALGHLAALDSFDRKVFEERR